MNYKTNIKIKSAGRTGLILTAFLIIILSSGNIFSQQPEAFFKLGNKLYQEEKYEEAIEAYQKIISQGFESAALYYNLGNAYYRTGKIGLAIYNYEKGLRLDPGDEDIEYNLRIANARTVDKITEVPKIFIVQWWEMLVTSFSVNGWSIITTVIFWIFVTSIGLFLLSRRINLQRAALLTGSLSLSALIISIVFLVARYNYETASDYGILTEQIYSVKTAPDSKSSDAFVIHEGIKFKLEDQVNGWVKIRLADGKVGWIQNDSFGKI